MEVIKPKKPLIDLAKFRPGLKTALRDIQLDGTRFMADYPDQVLTKTGYIRTGTLKRSWLQAHPVIDRGTSMETQIGSNANMAPYNQFIEGPADMQVPMFRGAGWQNVEDLIDLAEKRMQDDIQKVIREATE